MRAVVVALLMAVVMVVLAVPVRADVTITMENTTKSPAGEKTVKVVQYYTPTKMRNEYGDSAVMIIDLDKERIISLMLAAKMFTEQTFETMRKMGAAVRLPEQKITIEETDEQETISGYECHKVIVTAVQGDDETVGEFWVAEDVKGLDDVKAFLDGMAEALKDSPMHLRSNEVGRRLAAKGYFPIKTVMAGPGHGNATMTMTVTKIEVGDLDDSLFEVPDDYKEATVGGMGGGNAPSH